MGLCRGGEFSLGRLGVALLYAVWIGHLRLFLGTNLPAWVRLVIVVQNIVSSLFNSHLFDFTRVGSMSSV